MALPKRILVYRIGSLGDTVIALPCFHLIRRSFPSANISVLTNKPVEARAAPLASVLAGSGLIDDLLDYPLELRRVDQILALRSRIRAGRFDLVVHLTPARGLLNSVRDYLFFRWCGIANIVGIPFRNVGLDSAPIRAGYHEPEAVRLARRVRPIGDVDLLAAESWDLRLTEKEQTEAASLLAEHGIVPPFLAVSLGAKLAVKDWTQQNWTMFLNRLSHLYPSLPVVAVGAESERDAVDTSLAQWSGRAANWCGQTSARVSAAVLQRACLFVGHDSGPMHLASAVATPCVAIFSGHGPAGQWFPRGESNTILLPEKLCSTCSPADCRQINGKCILSISVDRVLDAVREQLASVLPMPTSLKN